MLWPKFVMIMLMVIGWGLSTHLFAAETPTNAVIPFLEQKIAQDPDDFVAINRLALAYLELARKNGNLDLVIKARSIAQKARQASTGRGSLGGLLALGQSELQLHHFRAALDCANEILRMEPNSPAAHGLQFDALIELGELEPASKTLSKLKKLGVQGAPLWARESRLDELQGRYEKAIQKIGRAAESDSSLLIRYGEILFKYGRPKLARAAYTRAMQEGNSGWSALDHLAELEGSEGHWDLAVASFESAIQLCPNRPELFQALGDLYMFRGDKKKATPYFQKAEALYEASISEGNDHFLHHLSGFYSDSDQQGSKAVLFAERDLSLRKSAYAYDTLAWATFKLGHAEKASSIMDNALVSGLKDPHVLYHAGMIYSLSGRLREGQDLLKQAQSINPYFMAFHTHR